MSDFEIVKEQSRLNPNVQVIKRVSGSPVITQIPGVKRVAAYCRVSRNLEIQESSIENQISSYERTIAEKPGWQLVGIYADRGISGTTATKRPEFQRMIKDAKDGKIDLIIAKSISRFARNTLDTLQYTRLLKDIGVGVYFEKERVDTESAISELLLTVFAAFAQEESISISENIKRGFRQNFALGRPKFSGTYGYRPNPDNKAEWFVIEEQAEIVRRIYNLFLSGVGLNDIGKILNSEGVEPPKGEAWYTTTIKNLIRNEKYVGDVTMQKTYSKDALTHKAMKNIDNMVEKYYVKDHHPAIISRFDYELAVRTLDLKNHKAGTHQYPYYEYLKCPHCGKPMIGFALKTHSERAWICSDFKNCKNDIIREKYIDRAVIAAVNSLPRAITGYEQTIKDSQDHFANDGKVELKVLKPLIKNIEIIDHKLIRIHFLFDKSYDYAITYDKPCLSNFAFRISKS